MGRLALDIRPWTLGFTEILIFHWCYTLFEECVSHGFGVLGCHALNLGRRIFKILIFHLFLKLFSVLAWNNVLWTLDLGP